MHGAGEERRFFSFDEELALQGKVGVPVYHIGRGGRGNVVDEEEEGGRRGSGGSKGSGSGSSGLGEGVRGSLEWIRGLGRKG